MTDDLARARFPAVPANAGHYESFYLKLADPQRPRGAWIRYTVLKRPGQPARGSLWSTIWTGDGPPRAHKVTLEPGELRADGADLIRIGDAWLSNGRAGGSTDGAEWELEYSQDAPPFPYLPRGWMYTGPLPKTKAVSLHPFARFRGRVRVGDQSVEADGWPGMVGHNWGAEHAERWIWLHAAGFPAAEQAWFDATIGRIKVGRLTVPWIANGGLFLDGRLHRLGGPGAIRATKVDERSTSCSFSLRGGGVTVRGEVQAPEELAVAWRYSDPSGGEHVTANCSVASLNLTVSTPAGAERRLELPAGAAYELGARRQPQELPIQPFPDP